MNLSNLKKITLLPFLLVFTTGCGDSKFAGRLESSPNQSLLVPYGEASRVNNILPPTSMALGGTVQTFVSPFGDERIAVESLIGQAINSKQHLEKGVRVSIGYPELQSAFAY